MWSNVGADGRSAEMLKAAQAAQHAEDLPRESARALVSLCRAVRLYFEAKDYALALSKLNKIAELTSGADDENVRSAFAKHVAGVRKYLEQEVQ